MHWQQSRENYTSSSESLLPSTVISIAQTSTLRRTKRYSVHVVRALSAIDNDNARMWSSHGPSRALGLRAKQFAKITSGCTEGGHDDHWHSQTQLEEWSTTQVLHQASRHKPDPTRHMGVRRHLCMRFLPQGRCRNLRTTTRWTLVMFPMQAGPKVNV